MTVGKIQNCEMQKYEICIRVKCKDCQVAECASIWKIVTNVNAKNLQARAMHYSGQHSRLDINAFSSPSVVNTMTSPDLS